VLAHYFTNSVLYTVLLVALLVVWVAWWLLAVNWKSLWPTLAEGAWVPGVLIVLVSALVWSRVAPADCTCLGFMTIPNFWWQLADVSLLFSLALFCGWLQGYLGWTPEAVSFEPAPIAHGHGHHHEHGHDHGHDHGHSHDHGHH
jgi:hypothetical protein